jgi:hypothetical protein
MDGHAIHVSPSSLHEQGTNNLLAYVEGGRSAPVIHCQLRRRYAANTAPATSPSTRLPGSASPWRNEKPREDNR